MLLALTIVVISGCSDPVENPSYLRLFDAESTASDINKIDLSNRIFGPGNELGTQIFSVVQFESSEPFGINKFNLDIELNGTLDAYIRFLPAQVGLEYSKTPSKNDAGYEGEIRYNVVYCFEECSGSIFQQDSTIETKTTSIINFLEVRTETGLYDSLTFVIDRPDGSG